MSRDTRRDEERQRELEQKRRSGIGDLGNTTRKLIHKAKYSISDPVLNGIKKGAMTTASAMAEAVHLPGLGRSITRSHLHPSFEVAIEDGVFEDAQVDPSWGWSSLIHPTPIPFVKAAGQVWEHQGKHYLVVTARSMTDRDKLGVYVMDCATAQWQQLTLKGAPSVRFGQSAVIATDALIIFGGWGRDEVYGETYFVDLVAATSSNRKGRWTQPSFDSPTACTKRAFHTASLLDDETLLIFGGSDFDYWSSYTYYNDLWKLDLIHFRWEKISCTGAIPAPRAQHTACTLERDGGIRDIVVFGGATGHWIMNDFYLLDTQKMFWTQIATPKSPFERVPSPQKAFKPPCAHRPAVTLKNSIYIYGGGPSSGEKKQKLLLACLIEVEGGGFTLAWEEAPVRFHPKRFYHTMMCTDEGGLFLVGGADPHVEGHSDKTASKQRAYSTVFWLDLNRYSYVEYMEDEMASDIQQVVSQEYEPPEHDARGLTETSDSFKTDVAFTMSDPFGGDFAKQPDPDTAEPPTPSAKPKRRSRDKRKNSMSDSVEHVPVHTSKMIGKGTFGKVYQGLHPATGEFVAVKQIKSQGVSIKDRDKIKSEINLLKDLEHENIVKYLGSYVKDGRVNIVMEYVSGGSLLGLISQYKDGLPEVVVQRYVRQITTGLVYLHSKLLLHRDIKPANILVDASGVCKVADFGASKVLSAATMAFQTAKTKTEVTGTPLYMAPEMISGKTTNDSRSDIWSLGCTVSEMLDGQRPWHHMGHLEAIPLCMYIASEQSTPQYPKKCTEKARRFLDRCWVHDVKQRATSSELLLLPFLDDSVHEKTGAGQSSNNNAVQHQQQQVRQPESSQAEELNKQLMSQIEAMKVMMQTMQEKLDKKEEVKEEKPEPPKPKPKEEEVAPQQRPPSPQVKPPIHVKREHPVVPPLQPITPTKITSPQTSMHYAPNAPVPSPTLTQYTYGGVMSPFMNDSFFSTYVDPEGMLSDEEDDDQISI